MSRRSNREIPKKSRFVVKARARGRCERCGVGTTLGQWHHRRRRAIVGEHRHCPCNGLWLCPTCHMWVHKNPTESRRHGWIVGSHIEKPSGVPVTTAWGTREHDCLGRFNLLSN